MKKISVFLYQSIIKYCFTHLKRVLTYKKKILSIFIITIHNNYAFTIVIYNIMIHSYRVHFYLKLKEYGSKLNEKINKTNDNGQ
jgi:hypothetical protein